MPLLSEKDRQFLKDHLAKSLEKPVKLVLFTQTIACQFCRETELVLREVEGLSDKISLEVYNLVTDKEVADGYCIDKIPATVVMSDVDYGVRFYGIPSGYEFTSLIEDIVAVSTGASDLNLETLKALEQIQGDVHIQVFATPTCPYCPAAVRLAHSLAIASPRIRADMIEAIEFPHLANKYAVQGVPKTVINESTGLDGIVPEPIMVAYVLKALGMATEAEVQALVERLAPQGAETEALQPGGSTKT